MDELEAAAFAAAAAAAPDAVFQPGVGWIGPGWERAQGAALRAWVDAKHVASNKRVLLEAALELSSVIVNLVP